MAMMTSLLNVVNAPEREQLSPGYPKLRPTVPLENCKPDNLEETSARARYTYYALTTSKNTPNAVKAFGTLENKWLARSRGSYVIIRICDTLSLCNAD